ncbi:MAG: hypothetical protein Ct9H300mP23_07700 [Nitrospinota bacterium]|nr:MAG: hypothetical protein Ct9H300mP23_07700 [Nitrospinota bacterium]
MPATAGYPDAREIPKHNGKAIKKTKNPERISCLAWVLKPFRFPFGVSEDSDEYSWIFFLFFKNLKNLGPLKKNKLFINKKRGKNLNFFIKKKKNFLKRAQTEVEILHQPCKPVVWWMR